MRSSPSRYLVNERPIDVMRASFWFSAVVLVFSLILATDTFSAQGDEHPTLPPGEGRDLMIRVCSQCHAPEVAADQQLDAEGWKRVVDQMASNGATATDAEFDQIVDYLVKAFPASK